MHTAHAGLYVVMGVAGSGKSLIGSMLARALGVAFVDGDDLHPAANVAKMAAGVALTDDDRAGWLGALAARLAEAREAGAGLVIACSALKRAYRDALRDGAAPASVRFVFLTGERALIADRLVRRSGHFMPASMLDGQLAVLEPPLPSEEAWTCDVREAPEAIVAALVRRASR